MHVFHRSNKEGYYIDHGVSGVVPVTGTETS